MFLKRFIRKKVNQLAEEAIGISATQLMDFVEDAKDKPQIKSVSGATDIYLRQITRDFPDYVPSEAEREIREYVNEYVAGQGGSNICINRISISGYRKSENYALVQYQCSVGYDRQGKSRCETRYILEYTMKLVEDGVAVFAMKCPNCGAALEKTDVTNCPYCDIKIIRDTILNWEVTSLREK